ncbi:MAG: hypothetical protein JSR83_26940 [Proteobacteria bacterium]|nr:hypothetical protein [Pseudomonadota bacterium]
MNARTPPRIVASERLSLLQVLTETIQSDAGLEERAARALAAKIVGKVRHRMCGEALYIAKQDPEAHTERDMAIRRDYDGSRASRERLQLRWDISRATFYRILREPACGRSPLER